VTKVIHRPQGLNLKDNEDMKTNPADKVERWPLERLVPYAKNSRTHSEEQVAQIAASIREWGWTTPILVDEAGSIIAGHGRLQAARRLQMTEVPVVVASGWSEAQKRAYVIADNKLALNAGWDNELLSLELGELGDLGFDLDLVGFTDEEIAALMPVQGTEPASPILTMLLPGAGKAMSRFQATSGCWESTALCAVTRPAWTTLTKLTGGQLADMWLTDPTLQRGLRGQYEGKAISQKRRDGRRQFRQFLRDAYTAADMVMQTRLGRFTSGTLTQRATSFSRRGQRRWTGRASVPDLE
jgi:hypothetical protein